MTYDEVFNLTEQEIDKQIEIELAYEGVPTVTRPEDPRILEKVEPDIDVFTVESFHTKDKAFAQAVIDLINNDLINNNLPLLCDYNYGKGSCKFVTRPYNSDRLRSMTVERLYSSSNVANDAGEISEANNAAKKRYDELLREYENAGVGVKEIRNIVMNRYWAVSNVNETIIRLRGKWMSYVALANDDITVARNFFDNAYTNEYNKLLVSAEEQCLSKESVIKRVFDMSPILTHVNAEGIN